MTNKMKQELINDVLTGLMVAAVFALGVPHDVLAQNLQAVGNASNTQIMDPFVKMTSYASYGIGSVMIIAGIAGLKKHADNPSSNPLNPPLGKLGAGAAFLAAPGVAGMLNGTATATGMTGSTNFTQTIGQ